ncbi:type IX secretion system plug protein [Wenyingzhuangia sp. IMCC45533]
MNYFYLWIVFLTTFNCFPQSEDAEAIKTVIVKSSLHEFSHPVHKLGSSIHFSFDDINGTQEEYYYNIVHCQIDWSPSNLSNSYYIDGYANFQINDFENSYGTLANYTHYSFTIPNNDTRITRSGNYLIQIVNNNDEVVCERKIVITEDLVNIGVKISESRDLELFNQKQAVSLVIDTKNLNINYPNTEIKTYIFQNGDLNLKSEFLQPTFIDNNVYTYRPSKKTEFFAGNEFYYFDNNDILRNSRFILRSYREGDFFHSILYPAKSRIRDIYKFNPDINGSFVIRNLNASDSDIEAEYSIVHFSLLNEKHLQDKDIYIYGAFNNYQLTDENKLVEDASGKYLTTSIYLKQGFYNFDFVTKINDIPKRNSVSGSFFETENTYEALVYFTPINSIYYQVVGYGAGNSKQQLEN